MSIFKKILSFFTPETIDNSLGVVKTPPVEIINSEGFKTEEYYGNWNIPVTVYLSAMEYFVRFITEPNVIVLTETSPEFYFISFLNQHPAFTPIFEKDRFEKFKEIDMSHNMEYIRSYLIGLFFLALLFSVVAKIDEVRPVPDELRLHVYDCVLNYSQENAERNIKIFPEFILCVKQYISSLCQTNLYPTEESFVNMMMRRNTTLDVYSDKNFEERNQNFIRELGDRSDFKK